MSRRLKILSEVTLKSILLVPSHRSFWRSVAIWSEEVFSTSKWFYILGLLFLMSISYYISKNYMVYFLPIVFSQTESSLRLSWLNSLRISTNLMWLWKPQLLVWVPHLQAKPRPFFIEELLQISISLTKIHNLCL